jgi:hypothetical protein
LNSRKVVLEGVDGRQLETKFRPQTLGYTWIASAQLYGLIPLPKTLTCSTAVGQRVQWDAGRDVTISTELNAPYS